MRRNRTCKKSTESRKFALFVELALKLGSFPANFSQSEPKPNLNIFPLIRVMVLKHKPEVYGKEVKTLIGQPRDYNTNLE